ncbi:MAG TPA: Gfo/Idh/MocA family oxidoreductase [Chthoniobacterales bacterium]|jgi:predicted dehydrogenase
MLNTPTPIGIIGCGNISGAYASACARFSDIRLVAVADIDLDRAKAKAAEYNIPEALSVEEILAHPEIKILINLTIPAAHASVATKILAAGKHAYNEKPLGVSLQDGQDLVRFAKEKGLRVGCAPDTFLGASLQTCRKLIDDGAIGRPLAASAFMLSGGPEHWHPDPEFFFKAGGGPMFDMGPYYLTALVSMLGPVKRVAGLTSKSFDERTVGKGPKKDQKITVDIPTHVAGNLQFESGIVASMVTSFDVHSHELPYIEIYGSEGTLAVPDPNIFGNPVRLRRRGETEFQTVPHTHGYSEGSRGIGVADMAVAIELGRAHRANGDLALHVLELMHAFHISSDSGEYYKMQSSVERPAPLPLGLSPGEVEL